jgi:hypothetical protein
MNTGPTPQDLLLAYDSDFVGFTGDKTELTEVVGGTIDGYYEDFAANLNQFAKHYPLMPRTHNTMVLPLSSEYYAMGHPKAHQHAQSGVVSLSNFIVNGRPAPKAAESMVAAADNAVAVTDDVVAVTDDADNSDDNAEMDESSAETQIDESSAERLDSYTEPSMADSNDTSTIFDYIKQ